MDELSHNIIDWGGRKTLWIDSTRVEECMNYYRQHNLDGIGISPFNGYQNDEIEFLKEHRYVKGIVLPYAKAIDISPIKKLDELTYVSIAENKQAIDLAIFPKLEEIRIEWHSKMLISDKCKNLRLLSLRRYKPKTKDLMALSNLLNLEDLAIVQSPLTTIRGIHRFPKLKRLELSYLSKLESIAALVELENSALEILECEKCRNVHDYESVRCLKNLKVLKLNDCGDIANISFLNEMPAIEEFRFVKTNVLDGNIQPCLRLKKVGFFAKKHYSHTPEEVDAVIRS